MALEAKGSNPFIHLSSLWVSSIKGYRQAVRHSTLTAAFAGSNPASPVFKAVGLFKTKYGALAQSVEHLTFNQVVRGSNPRCFTTEKRCKSSKIKGCTVFACSEICKSNRL